MFFNSNSATVTVSVAGNSACPSSFLLSGNTDGIAVHSDSAELRSGVSFGYRCVLVCTDQISISSAESVFHFIGSLIKELWITVTGLVRSCTSLKPSKQQISGVFSKKITTAKTLRLCRAGGLRL